MCSIPARKLVVALSNPIWNRLIVFASVGDFLRFSLAIQLSVIFRHNTGDYFCFFARFRRCLSNDAIKKIFVKFLIFREESWKIQILRKLFHCCYIQKLSSIFAKTQLNTNAVIKNKKVMLRHRVPPDESRSKSHPFRSSKIRKGTYQPPIRNRTHLN